MTLPRHDPADAPGPSDEFWGEHTEWTPRPARSTERAGIGSLVGRWWDSLLGHGATGERTHGRPTGSPAPSDEYDRPVERSSVGDDARELPDEHAGDEHGGDEAWELEPEPQPSRHPGVDPLLARLGGLAVIVTLAAPLVVGFSASGADSPDADSMLSTVSTAPISEFTDPTTAGVAPTSPAPPATTDSAAPTATAASTPGAAVSAPVTSTDAADADAVPGDTSDAASPAVAVALETSIDTEPASTTPASTTPPCGSRYELAAGDYWIRIADAAGVALAALLAVNEASIDSVLVPGRAICLPVGAATPSPPTTAASAPAATTPTPATTTPATTAPPRRSTPTTTTPPAATTTAPSRPSAVPPSRAVEIIREVWPDDLEERAIDIAWRESNHRSNVNNYCCYGLFQIHWNAHRSWLSTLGVTSVSQLFDPVVNTNVAYALYQRSGGFGPWGG
jgi:LysM repeat protein